MLREFWRRKYKVQNSMNLIILNLAFFWILQNWFDQFWQQQKCGPFWSSNSLWTRATIFECCKRNLKIQESLARHKNWLGQRWGLGEVTCNQINCKIMTPETTWEHLKPNQMSSNPHATWDHHMNCQDQTPWQVTSSTDKVRYMVIC